MLGRVDFLGPVRPVLASHWVPWSLLGIAGTFLMCHQGFPGFPGIVQAGSYSGVQLAPPRTSSGLLGLSGGPLGLPKLS